MVDVKKLGKKHVHYCTHCDNRASYLLYFTNPVIIQQGSNGALCEKCFELLKNAIIKISTLNKHKVVNKVNKVNKQSTQLYSYYGDISRQRKHLKEECGDWQGRP